MFVLRAMVEDESVLTLNNLTLLVGRTPDRYSDKMTDPDTAEIKGIHRWEFEWDFADRGEADKRASYIACAFRDFFGDTYFIQVE